MRGWNAVVGKKVSYQSKTIRLFDFRVCCFKTPEYVSLLSKRLRCCLSVFPGDIGLLGSKNSASRFWLSALMTSSGKKSTGKSTDSKSSSEETETSD